MRLICRLQRDSGDFLRPSYISRVLLVETRAVHFNSVYGRGLVGLNFPGALAFASRKILGNSEATRMLVHSPRWRSLSNDHILMFANSCAYFSGSDAFVLSISSTFLRRVCRRNLMPR